MNASVGLVVVNFNSGVHLRACLESLPQAFGTLCWHAIVVDNASTDESLRATDAMPRVRVVRNLENVGFARAVNQAVRLTDADRLLLLNPDCRLSPGAAESMFAELDRYPDCAVLGPMVLDDDGSVQGSARGDPAMVTGLFGRSTWLTRRFPHSRFARRSVRTNEAIASGQTSATVDWVSGACMSIRRSAFERVGGFDERYFLYWEDADLCRRLRRAGFSTRYFAAASVVHAAGQSSRTVRPLAIRAFHDSAYIYYKTHVAPWDPVRRLLAKRLLALRCRYSLKRAGVA